ncbi:MAG: chemotaxis protein CheX [Bdellovibrionaceae bacterium]|nr:chemotaxis protein CheX [Pseudobdellovibrionaceae bacterium]
MSADFIQPFIDGTIETIKKQVGIHVSAGNPIVNIAHNISDSIDIGSFIHLDSLSFKGKISLFFHGETYLNIYNKMLNTHLNEINEDIHDGACELLSIIYGFAKTELNYLGHKLDLAIPNIIHGKEIKVPSCKDSQCLLLPFNSEAGDFYLELSYAKEKKYRF